MIKNFRRSDIQDTPFVATRNWVLGSFHTEDNLILEQSASIGIEIPLALEFIDYGNGDNNPVVNSDCNLSLQKQPNDQASYEEGLKIGGTFYPGIDPVNPSGTFKRLVYSQIRNAFYNTYQNPTKMFGLENIDFQLSGIKKFLADRFRVFTIDRELFGEKMLENSVILIDNSLDDNFVITDDGQGNIIAKENLFSRVQEVRPFPKGFVDGNNGYDCPGIIVTTTTTTTSTTSTTTPTTTTTLTTTKAGTTSTTTTPTTTTTSTTPTTTTTTTTTPTTTTTTTSTSTTTTTTTSTQPPATTPTTTSTSTSTATTTTTTTTTSTTTSPPSLCTSDFDCYIYGDSVGNPIYIDTVHWKPYSCTCGCRCEVGRCDKLSTCRSIFGQGIEHAAWEETYDEFGNLIGQRDGYGRITLVRVQSKDGDGVCTDDCSCGTEGCPDEPTSGNSTCCSTTAASNNPSSFTACWQPVLDALQNLGCMHYDVLGEVDATCSNPSCGDPPVELGTICCDKQKIVSISWVNPPSP